MALGMIGGSDRQVAGTRPRVAAHARARVALLVAVLFALPVKTGCAQSAGSPLDQAHAALNAGDYETALRQYRDLAESSREDDAVRGYGRTFEATGAYAEGIARMDALIASGVPTAAMHHARGRLLQRVGRYEDAGRAYVAALQLQAECWSCRVDLADLLVLTGRAREASSLYADVYLTWEQGVFRTAPDLTVAARAAAALDRFRDANEAFRTGHEIDPTDVENLVAWAELFRRKFNEADARRTFEEALAVNPRHAEALVGMARSGLNFERQEELARSALASNPNLPDALVLLAGLHTLDGAYDRADSLARRALAVNPRDVDALAQLASARYLRGDSTGYLDAERQALAVSPRSSDFYLTVSENATRRYRYRDAVRFAARAVDVDARDARAHAEYGNALLRLGDRARARMHLQAAFEFDPFNLFASNTLTLLDQLDGFAELVSQHFRLLIHPDEAEVLGPLMLESAEQAYAAFRERYPYEPRDKILIEAYNDADDFAVRVAGVPHRGLLGVCFGDVLAVNTPVAQGGDDYNWARTLWHEIAHTMAIGVSEHHVPRWFTEGLSVYEEARARPEWGREMRLAFLSAFDQGRVLPLSEIDRGFTRPAFPGQVILSYYHASRVIEMIAEEHGFEAITGILQAFGEGKSTAEAVRSVLEVDLATLDARLAARLSEERRQMASALEGLPDLLATEDAEVSAETAARADGAVFRSLRTGAERLRTGDYAAAERAYEAALRAFPEYAGPENAYLGLAEVYHATNRPDARIDMLRRYLDIAEHDVAVALELAELLESRGDAAAATALRERSLYVAPYDAAVRTALADGYERDGAFDRAVLHRRAVVALNPPDRAGAQYRLAMSLFESGRRDEARRAVLMALEMAPGYREAQRLLLQIVQ